MPTIDGTDDGDKGYGVLGRGTPYVYQDQDGSNVSVNSVGVWGMLGTAADMANIEDEVAGTLGQTVNAAIAGRNTLPNGGHAVYGERRPFLSPTTAFGSLAATDRSGQPAGVYGESELQGVAGLATGAGTGVYGRGRTGGSFDGTFEGVHAVSHDPLAAGVAGYNVNTGPFVYGKSVHGAAGYFDGNVVVTGDVSVTGDVRLTGGDLAEHFEVVDPSAAEPGTVMVLDGLERVRVSDCAYDRKVVGIISGAGSYRPGVVLNHQADGQTHKPLALVGKTFCKVDASFGSVEVGDLLTTSPTPGYAMKATKPDQSFGAVLGKAMGSLSQGRALLPIVVTLR